LTVKRSTGCRGNGVTLQRDDLAPTTRTSIITRTPFEFEGVSIISAPPRRDGICRLVINRMTIDWTIVLDFVDQQPTLLRELIDIFFIEHAHVMPRIAEAVERRDADALRLYAHRMKGCLRYFGINDAIDVAAQLEHAGRSGIFDDAAQLMTKLQKMTDAMLLEMRAYQNDHLPAAQDKP